jgi:formate hydrogenlyase subunit 4
MWIYILTWLVGLLLVPLFDAVIRKTKAFLNWRRWPSFFQTYYDLFKLFQKENFISQFTSVFSHIAPVVILLISIIFFFLVPLSFQGISINVIVIIFVFWIGALFLALYGMDNATYFWWLGASREMFVLLLVESLLLLTLGFLCYTTGARDLEWLRIAIVNSYTTPLFLVQIIIFAVALWYIIIAETKRYPFDNPTTHLELTMIHEAMLLETSGPALWIIELAAKINLIGFMSLFAYIILPFDFGSSELIVLFLLRCAKIIWMCIFLWVWETYVTKLRIFKYPVMLFSLLAIQILFVIFYKIILW